MIESLLGAATTVHRGGQAEITVDGDTASGIWAMDDRIWSPAGPPSSDPAGTGRPGAPPSGWLIATMRCRHRVEVDGVVISADGTSDRERSALDRNPGADQVLLRGPSSQRLVIACGDGPLPAVEIDNRRNQGPAVV